MHRANAKNGYSMNTMIKRISEAVRKAIDEAPYQIIGNTEYWIRNNSSNRIEYKFKSFELARAKIKELKDEWIARKVVESMKGDLPADIYVNYSVDGDNTAWKDLNSTKVWNAWINAILKE